MNAFLKFFCPTNSCATPDAPYAPTPACKVLNEVISEGEELIWYLSIVSRKFS